MTPEPGQAVEWEVRQTGFGVRSWALDMSKVHVVGPEGGRTWCGRPIGRHPSPASDPTKNRCRQCWGRA